MIAVGMMDRQVSYYKPSTTANVNYGGNSSVVWNLFDNDYAHIIWKTGSDIGSEGMQMQDNQIVEFYVRNGSKANLLSVQDYVLYGAKKYYIKSIDVIDGRRKYLRISGTSVRPTKNA